MSEESKSSGKAVWDLEESNPDKARLLKESLRNVHDPELGYSVIELGLIRNVVDKPDHTFITMILTTPFCPYAGSLVEQVRLAAADEMEKEVFVDLKFDPWEPEMMEEDVDLGWGLY